MSNETMNFEAFLDDFEATGATLSSPILPEGKYRANLGNFSLRSGIATIKKGKNKGEETVWSLWGLRLVLDSATATEVMKRDGDISVYADNDTINLRRGSLALFDYGIAKNNNVAFWNFVGNALHQVGLAEEVKQDSGESSYNIDRNALNAIYANTKEKFEELQTDSELDARLIPAKLAEHQLGNLTEFLTSEPETRALYAHIARRSNYQDKSKQEHYVKQIIFPADFEASQDNLDSLLA